MRSKLPRLAVVGAGYWGTNLVRVASELGVLAAVCDADPHNVDRALAVQGELLGTTVFTELLDERAAIDAIVLATPAPLHAPYALAAIAAGKDVFVEKPLALTSVDADAVVRAASLARRKVFVGHLLRYHPGVRALLASIKRGDIGDVVHVRSRRLSWGKLRAVENVWWSFAPHDVALVLAAFEGELPRSVSAAQTSSVRPGSADFAYADLCFSRGRTAHIEASWLDVEKSARLDVFGTAGVLTFEDRPTGASLRCTPAGVFVESGAPMLWRSPPVPISFEPAEPLKVELAAFVDWIMTGVEPPTDAAEGASVVRVLEMAQGAADSPAPVYEVPA
jgi:predicted dehydrogenase